MPEYSKNTSKVKIINILYHPPPYESYRKGNRPVVSWDITNSNWVGIWGYDWPDLLGSEVLKISNEFDYEVWQPDLRADKIYTHNFENGLVHKLFPTNTRREIFGFKMRKYLDLSEIKKALSRESKYVLHINTPNNCNNKLFVQDRNPKIFQYHSLINTPYTELKKFRYNFLSYINIFFNHLIWCRNNKVFHIYNNSKNLNSLNYLKSIGVKRIFMGCDFDYWTPGNKYEAKLRMAIDHRKTVFTMASRFSSLKQIDKFINVLDSEEFNDLDFLVLIAGHGAEDYEDYLFNQAAKLRSQEKLRFTGYLTGDEMLSLYRATDLFVSASTYEGGPVSVMKAIACEIPVMSTRVNGVDDILQFHNAGILVNPFDYSQWEKELLAFLKGREAKVLNREIAKKYFHWPNIAKDFLNVYSNLKPSNINQIR